MGSGSRLLTILTAAAVCCGSGVGQPGRAPSATGQGPRKAGVKPPVRTPVPISVYFAGSLGVGRVQEVPPMLTGASPAFLADFEVGIEPTPFLQLGISLTLGESFYDNPVAPPPLIDPDDTLELSRLGVGPRLDVHLPAGRVRLGAAGAIYLQRVRAVAGGSFLGIAGAEYFDESDTSLAGELAAALDWRLSAVGAPDRSRLHATAIGVWAGWQFYRADLDGLTREAAWLGGPFVALRLEFGVVGLVK